VSELYRKEIILNFHQNRQNTKFNFNLHSRFPLCYWLPEDDTCFWFS